MNKWIEVSLRDITKINYGKGLPKIQRKGGNVPVYGSNGIIGWHNEALVNNKGIILGRKGSVGAVKYSSVPFHPIDTSYFITSDDTNLSLDFLYYLLIHIDLSRLVSDLVPGLNRDLTYAEKCKIPKCEQEQVKIVSVLSLVQKAISEQEKAITLTTELKKALMQKLFTEGLNNRELGLKEVFLRDIAIINYGKALTKRERKIGNVPVYGSNGIIGWHNKCLVDQQGIIIGRKGTVGAIHYSSIPFYPIDTSYFITSNDAKINLSFLYYLLIFTDLSRLVSDLVPGLNRDLVYSEKLLIPESKEEQKKIVEILKCIDAKVHNFYIKKQKLQDLFQTLLHQLMTAQIRVDELDLSVLETQIEEVRN